MIPQCHIRFENFIYFLPKYKNLTWILNSPYVGSIFVLNVIKNQFLSVIVGEQVLHFVSHPKTHLKTTI